MDKLFWQLLLQLFLIVLNAVFACAEIAVISINDNKLAKLAEAGNKKAVRLARLTSKPARFLATIQVAITLAGFMGSAFAADNFSERLVALAEKAGSTINIATLDTIAVIAVTLILSYLTLVFGELVPKRIAMRNAEKLALNLSGAITFIAKVFAPLVWLLTVSTNGILRLLGIDPNAEDSTVTEEEIRMMVDVGSEKGTIDKEERELIQNIFEFDDTSAEDLMTHRVHVALLFIEENDEEWAQSIRENRHTFFPVCEESADNIIGVISTKDYFRLEDKSRDSVLKTMTQPLYVPETVNADVLFKKMRAEKNFFAVVIDEYGGMSGIVTLNDLLECLVGDLEDDGVLIKKVDASTWEVSGEARVDDVALAIGVQLPQGEYDTFGGLIIDTLGEIPDDGEPVEINEFGLCIRVTGVADRRIEKAVVCKTNAC